MPFRLSPAVLGRLSGASAFVKQSQKPTRSSGRNNKKSNHGNVKVTSRYGGNNTSTETTFKGKAVPGVPGSKKALRVEQHKMRVNLAIGEEHARLPDGSYVPQESQEDPYEEERMQAAVDELIHGYDPDRYAAIAAGKREGREVLEGRIEVLKLSIESTAEYIRTGKAPLDVKGIMGRPETPLLSASSLDELDEQNIDSLTTTTNATNAVTTRPPKQSKPQPTQLELLTKLDHEISQSLRKYVLLNPTQTHTIDSLTTYANDLLPKNAPAGGTRVSFASLGAYTFVSIVNLSHSKKEKSHDKRALQVYKLLKLLSPTTHDPKNLTNPNDSLLANKYVVSELIHVHCQDSDDWKRALKRFRDITQTYLSLQPPEAKEAVTIKESRRLKKKSDADYFTNSEGDHHPLMSSLLPSYTSMLWNLAKASHSTKLSHAQRDDVTKTGIDLHREMIMLGVGPVDRMVDIAVMRMYFKGGNVEKGIEILERMGDDGDEVGSKYIEAFKGIARSYGIDKRYGRENAGELGPKGTKIYYSKLMRRVLDKFDDDDCRRMIMRNEDGRFWSALAMVCGAVGDARAVDAIYKVKEVMVGGGRMSAIAEGDEEEDDDDDDDEDDFEALMAGLDNTDNSTASSLVKVEQELERSPDSLKSNLKMTATDYSVLLSSYARSMSPGNTDWGGLDNSGFLSRDISMNNKIPRMLQTYYNPAMEDTSSIHGLSGTEAGIANLKWDEFDDDARNNRGKLKRVQFKGFEEEGDLGTGRWEAAVQPPLADQLFGTNEYDEFGNVSESRKRFLEIEHMKDFVGADIDEENEERVEMLEGFGVDKFLEMTDKRRQELLEQTKVSFTIDAGSGEKTRTEELELDEDEFRQLMEGVKNEKRETLPEDISELFADANDDDDDDDDDSDEGYFSGRASLLQEEKKEMLQAKEKAKLSKITPNNNNKKVEPIDENTRQLLSDLHKIDHGLDGYDGEESTIDENDEGYKMFMKELEKKSMEIEEYRRKHGDNAEFDPFEEDDDDDDDDMRLPTVKKSKPNSALSAREKKAIANEMSLYNSHLSPAEKYETLLANYGNDVRIVPLAEVVCALREPLPPHFDFNHIRSENFTKAVDTIAAAIKHDAVDAVVLNAGLSAFVASGRLRTALDYYNNMYTDVGIDRDERADRIMIEGLCKSKRMDMVLTLKKEIAQRQENAGIDAISYGHMIRLFANKGRLEVALSLLSECVDKHGTAPTEHYVKSLRALCRTKGFLGIDGKVIDERKKKSKKDISVVSLLNKQLGGEDEEWRREFAMEKENNSADADFEENENSNSSNLPAISVDMDKYAIDSIDKVLTAVSIIPVDPIAWIKRGQGKTLKRSKGMSSNKTSLLVRNALLR